MRRIGTLPTAEGAERFGRYLNSLGIEHRADRQDGEWEIWVYDEDRVENAREALEEFTQSPDDRRFDVEEPPPAPPRPEPPPDFAPSRPVPVEEGPVSDRFPVTIVLIVVSIAVTLTTDFGKSRPEIIDQLLITQYDKAQVGGNVLREVTQGELWRLYTPMFLHFHMLHLLFNMYMTWILGGIIERVKGSLRFSLLVLAIAPISHLAQFVTKHGAFGGMSGVVYGLFGYMWMKAVFSPREGFLMPGIIVAQMMIWMFLGMTGALGNIANAAHFGGLVAGMALGAAPALFRR
jgi:GlpG protein